VSRSFIVVLAALTGCSFTMDSVPSSYRAQRGGPPPACSTSLGAPLIDGVVAASATTLFVVNKQKACSDPDDPDRCGRGTSLVAALFLPPAVLYGIAAIVGLSKASTCSRVTKAHARLQVAP